MADFSTLRLGSTGPYVELLQLALYRAGFYAEQPDGIFGQRTHTAVTRFQTANSLTPDGIVGPRTWSALNSWLTGYLRRTVKQGDTVYRLARTYDTTVRAIEAANPGIDPLNLQIGSTLIIPRDFDVVATNIRFTPTYLELCITGLKARYPFLRTGSVGQSVMGRPISSIEIGSGENQVFYNASHHANEWITTPLLMKYLENYCRAYVFSGTIFGQRAASLFELTTLYMIPMVNPDGVALVTGELTEGSYYDRAVSISQDYPSIPFPDGWKANISGIDPNLQYPAGWNTAREIKFAQGYVSPAPRDYVGAAPLEIPESRAVYNYTRAHDFSLTLSYHTQGRVIYWRYLNFLPDNSFEIAQKFAAVSGYSVEVTPEESGYAGYKDWFIYAYDRPGYTIEAGQGISPLPLSQFDEIYSDNEGILTLALTATL
ncbi:MAG: M14 family metallopeptidase [Oscillospiraceae bacterium]